MNQAIDNFVQALALSGRTIEPDQIEIRDLGCPHEPTALPRGKMASYIIMHGHVALKIGKAGPNSSARFQSQHYSPGSSNSNLAKSLMGDETSPCYDMLATNVGAWMKANLRRYDILLDARLGIPVLNFLETFLQCKFSPKYEGFKSQRNGA